MHRRLLPAALLLVWAIAAVLGWAFMARFAATPGAQAAAPRILPAILDTISPSAVAGRPMHIFVALHPECSCSRATLRELVRALGDRPASRDFELTLLLYQPRRLPAGWKQNTGLADQAAGLHPRLVADIDGEYASALHAETSGEVLLYSSDRRLLFQGGLTRQRGHDGASVGSALLLAALDGKPQAGGPISVFGCPILAATSRASRTSRAGRGTEPGGIPQ